MRAISLVSMFLLAGASACSSTDDPGARDAQPDAGFSNADAALDAGFADADSDGAVASHLDGSSMGTACRVNDECQEGLFCQYWTPGCDQLGECLPHPRLDGSTSCRGICDCDGYWRGNVHTDFPFQSRVFGPEAASCLPSDGGVDPDAWVRFSDSGSSCGDAGI